MESEASATNEPLDHQSSRSNGYGSYNLLDSVPSSGIIYSLRESKPINSKWYLAYYIPVLDWLANYSWSAFPGDFFSGITLASFQIPVSLSYATTLAHLDATCGLCGLIVPPLVYALLGTVPVMVVAPEGPTSLIIGKLSPRYFSDAAHSGHSTLTSEEISSLISGSAGALILFMGLLRSGFLTSILSQSLLRGFITGVGIVMIADQVPAMLGISKSMHKAIGLDASSFEKAKYTWTHWRQSNHVDCKFSLYALAALLIFKLLKQYLVHHRGFKRAVLIPDILLVVAISTVVSRWGKFAERGLSVIGDVETDKFQMVWPLRPKYWSDFKINFQSSFFICILGLLESTIAARLLGSSISGSDTGDTNSLRSTNRELVALGTANVIGSLFGALPSFGGYGRSKINMLSGGTSQISGIISALVTFLCTYHLMDLVYYLPRCTLSAVIATIGLSLLEEAPHETGFFWKMRSYSDLMTIFLSVFTTFFWSVEAGVTIGAGLALVRIIHHATMPRIQILTKQPDTGEFVNADEFGNEEYICDSGVLVVKIPEPLTFANSTVLDDRLRRLEMHGTTKVHPGQPRSRHCQLEVVVFHLKGMTEIDASASATLGVIIRGYLNRGIRVIFTDLVSNPGIKKTLLRSGINEMLESQPWDQAYYNTLQDAMSELEEN